MKFDNLQLVLFPNEILTTECETLTPEEIQEVIANFDKLLKFKEVSKGVGISAPQIGINKRFFIANNELFINPEIIKYNNDKIEGEESCLSLPKEFYIVKRSIRVRIKYIDLKNQVRNVYLTGLRARIAQHEFDHLNGKLITKNES